MLQGVCTTLPIDWTQLKWNELFQYNVTVFSCTLQVLLRCHFAAQSVKILGLFLQQAACTASVFIQRESQSLQMHCAWPSSTAHSLSHAPHPSTGTSCLSLLASRCCFPFICHCVHWMPLISFRKATLTDHLYCAECSSQGTLTEHSAGIVTMSPIHVLPCIEPRRLVCAIKRQQQHPLWGFLAQHHHPGKVQSIPDLHLLIYFFR